MNNDKTRQWYEWQLLAQFILGESVWVVCSSALAWAQKPAQSVQPADFQDHRNLLIFLAIKHLLERDHGRLTLVAVEERLRQQELLEEVGEAFFLEFSGAVVAMGLNTRAIVATVGHPKDGTH
jgi:hypothetical protein